MKDNIIYNQYNAFLKAYRPISRFAVDLSLLKTDEIHYPRDFEIDEDEFFDRLYVKRKQEELITSALLNSPNVILLIGEKGSGKTCMCLNVSRELRKRTTPLTLVISFDIRLEGFSLPITILEPKQIDSELLDKLREKYLATVFPYEEKTLSIKGEKKSEIPLLRLIAYMVDPQQEKPRGFEFETISIELRLLYKQFLTVHGETKRATYYEWLVEEHIRDDRIRNFIQELLQSKKLSVPFLMHATHSLYNYERQCIWIDNVDTLSTAQQARIQTIIKRLSSSISQIANVIVPVRDRNVFKQYEYDEFQAPPYQTSVRLYTVERDEVPALEITKISIPDVREIIRKRLDFSFERHNRLAAEQIKSSSTEAQKHLETEEENFFSYQHPIERDIYENILHLSGKILSMWESIEIPYLANNSIRTLLEHHCEFMSYLLNTAITRHKRASQNKMFPSFSSYGIRGMTTEYLAWIRRSNIRENTIGFYDVIADKDAWLESGKTIVGCTIEHLIITAIWNLTLRKPIYDAHTYKIPKVGQVIEKLIGLGYERSKILQVMNSLYHEDEIRTHFIEIQSQDGPLNITTPEEIKDDFLVYVTPRGKSISRYVINTFGYVFECILNNARNQNAPTASYFTGYLNIDEKKAVDLMLPHLCDVADMHIQTLIKIRDSPNPYVGKDWMKKYLDDFGIPIKSSHTIGESVNGRKKSLQFETMLDGIIRFTNLDENISRLSSLLNVYKDLLNTISNYKETSDHISVRDTFDLNTK